MAKQIDLQTHTWYSDGAYSPTQIVRLASQYGFGTIAITDHHSIAGIAEAEREGNKRGVRIVRGVEFYAQHRGKEVHLLGYNIQINSPELLRFIAQSQLSHKIHTTEVCKKLERAGFSVPAMRIQKSHSEFLGLGELIAYLMKIPSNKKRIVRELGDNNPDLFDIINMYFQHGGIAHVSSTEKGTPASRIIHLILKAGGIPVLAHPGTTLTFREDGVIEQLKKIGLRGLEAITPHHNWHQMSHYQELAARMRLYITAGSDTHGPLLAPRLLIAQRWDMFHPLQTRLPWEHQK